MKRFAPILSILAFLLSTGFVGAASPAAEVNVLYLPMVTIPTTGPVMLNDHVRFWGAMGEGRMEGVVTDYEYHAKLVGHDNITYTPQGHFLVVTLKVTNNSTEAALIDHDNLMLSDGGGLCFDLAELDEQEAAQLESKHDGLYDEMTAGETATMVFVWDVPTEAVYFTLVGTNPW